MTGQRDQLIAYLATLFALVLIVLAALYAISKGVTLGESVGVSIAIGGLIGVLKIPTQRNVHVDNPPSDPVPTADTSSALELTDEVK